MTTSTPERPRRRRAALLVEPMSNSPDCSGRSWWSALPSPSSPGSGRTPFTIYRCAASRPASPSSAARPACRSPTAGSPTVRKTPTLRAFLVGIVNTLRVAVIGIVLATVRRHAGRHRAAVVELAAVAACRGLCRGAARPAAAAAAAVLVRADAGPSRGARRRGSRSRASSSPIAAWCCRRFRSMTRNLWVLGAAAVGLIALYAAAPATDRAADAGRPVAPAAGPTRWSS